MERMLAVKAERVVVWGFEGVKGTWGMVGDFPGERLDEAFSWELGKGSRATLPAGDRKSAGTSVSRGWVEDC